MSDTQAPAISVLVPIYNVEPYLRQCLQSICNQDFSDFEVICINDGSTDGSLSIIDEFVQSDKRFTVIDKPNSGYGHSMNCGLDKALGLYIAILESDDFYEPFALRTLYNEAISSEADVVKANFCFYWSDAEKAFRRTSDAHLLTKLENKEADLLASGSDLQMTDDSEVYTYTEHAELFSWVQEGDPSLIRPLEYVDVFYRKPSIWSALYKKDFLFNHNIRFLETPGASFQDTSFTFKVWLHAQKVALVRESILFYRQDNETSSVNAPGKLYCVCDEYDEIVRACEKEKSPEISKILNPVIAKMRFDTYMWNYERVVEDLQKEFLMRMQKDFASEDAQGVVDLDYFEPYKQIQRTDIVKRPLHFHAYHKAAQENLGFCAKLIQYYRIGGVSLLMRIVKDRLRG